MTYPRFSSAICGEHEVRNLHAELAEIEVLARRVVVDHGAARSGPRRPASSEFLRSAQRSSRLLVIDDAE